MSAEEGAPKPRISGAWKVILYGLSIVFDVLRFIFSIFVFAAPFIAGVLVKVYLEANNWPSWIANVAGVAVGASTALTEAVLTPVAGALAIFGTIMALATGLFAWLVLFLILLMRGVNPFAHKQLSTSLLGFALTETPLINMLPTITTTLWFKLRQAAKEDKEKLAKWQKEQEALPRVPRTRLLRQAQVEQAAQAAG
jgi:hypothetical protein